MNYFWIIKVFDDGAAEDEPARLTTKGSGSLTALTNAIACIALEMGPSDVLDISVDPLPVGAEA